MQVSESEFKIVAVSDKYLSLTSTKREDLIGRDPFDIFPDREDQPDGAVSTRNAILNVWKTGRAVIIPDYLYYINSPTSGKLEPYWWRSSFEPILDAQGKVEFVLGTAVDQTEHHIVHQNLDKAEQMLHLAIEAADIGIWSIDVKSKAIVSSARSKALYGLPEHEFSSLDRVLDAIHPDYRQKAADTLNRAITSDGQQSFVIDYPVKGIKDKQERWVRSTAKLFYETADNRPVVCGTLIDITESKLLEQKQNDFIAMVSHEMKTPLTVVMGYLDLVLAKARKVNDGFISNSIFKARTQTSKLKMIIGGFLDVAGMDEGKLVLNKTVFSFRALATEVIDEIMPIAFDHSILFEQGQDMELYADRAKIGQVLTNFLSNAIKYSPSGTEVKVGYIVSPDELKVTVEDQGIGVKPEHQQKLFDRFYRVDHSRKSKAGFGIGLYLAAEVIKAHQGSVGVTSENSRGAVFWFILPSANMPGNVLLNKR